MIGVPKIAAGSARLWMDGMARRFQRPRPGQKKKTLDCRSERDVGRRDGIEGSGGDGGTSAVGIIPDKPSPVGSKGAT